MTNQELFDLNYRHFVFNDGPPSFVGDNCSYRGADGAKCGIGLALPDELYLPEMENKSITMLTDEYPALAAYFGGCDDQFLSDIQGVHDESVTNSANIESGDTKLGLFGEYMHNGLTILADDYQLTVPA